MNTARRHALTFLALAALGSMSGAGLAGEVILYRQGVTPDPNDIAKIFGAPQAPAASKTKTRGLRLLTDTPPPAVEGLRSETDPAPTGNADRMDGTSAVALQVQFPFNSAEIQPDMVAALDAVAEGIKMAGGNMRIVVEGHTDAVGGYEYNLRLSQRRAAAVKQYMVARHGISAQTLEVVGMGKSQPLIPQNPYAAENRRVQFRAVDPSSTHAQQFSPGKG